MQGLHISLPGQPWQSTADWQWKQDKCVSHSPNLEKKKCSLDLHWTRKLP